MAEYYQVATEEQFSIYNVDLSTARKLLQEGKYKGMYVRHLEYSNGHMQDMWSDVNMQPLTKSELDSILSNEPSEVI